jgi:hypothetical protein
MQFSSFVTECADWRGFISLYAHSKRDLIGRKSMCPEGVCGGDAKDRPLEMPALSLAVFAWGRLT